MHSLPYYQHPHQSGPSVTADEPTLTHHNHPESIVHHRVHSWSCTFCGFGQMHNDMWVLLWHHIQCFYCLKNPLCSTCSSLPTPQALATTDLFIVFIVLPFPECHVIGFIKNVAFSYWLLSLSNMPLRFLHAFSWLDTFSLWLVHAACGIQAVLVTEHLQCAIQSTLLYIVHRF